MAFKNGIIDLRSDTVTQPTEEMRRAMADAEVGDDVYGEDITVNRLEELAAEKIGKQAALFVASGTMGNLVAVLTHCERGDEVIMGNRGHTFLHEVGGISALGGIFPHTLPNQSDGTILLKDLHEAYREEDIHHPVSKLLILENTQNQCGGIPITLKYMQEISAFIQKYQLNLHLDGARIFNASLALGLPVAELCKMADSVMFCLSKGLCAPIGSMLCGSEEFVQKARRMRKQVGGGMRQAGIIAAAGLISLEKMIDRLVEDHERAKILADGLSAIPGLEFDKGFPQTNMLFLQLTSHVSRNPEEIIYLLKQRGILIGQSGLRNFRLVTHYWIHDQDLSKIINHFREVVMS